MQVRKFQAMTLPILLALLLLLESSQSLRKATIRLLRYSNQEQKISAIEVNSLLETSLSKREQEDTINLTLCSFILLDLL